MRNLTRTCFVLFSVMAFCFGARGQSCGSCSFTISGVDSSAYTLGPGQTLCLDSLGVFTGTIAVNGGTVCNRGLFHPMAFTLGSGSISNHYIAIFDQSLELDSGFVLLNGPRATFGMDGQLTISNGSVTNAGLFSVAADLVFNSGTFSNSSVVTCRYLLGTAMQSITNSGIISKQ